MHDTKTGLLLCTGPRGLFLKHLPRLQRKVLLADAVERLSLDGEHLLGCIRVGPVGRQSVGIPDGGGVVAVVPCVLGEIIQCRGDILARRICCKILLELSGLAILYILVLGGAKRQVVNL